MTYTYSVSSVPRWVGRPKNTWLVEPLGDQRCRVGFRPEIDASALGKVAFRLSGFKLEDLASQVLEDLKHYAESGEPSPSKRAALD